MELKLKDQKHCFLDLCHSTIRFNELCTLKDWFIKADFFEAPARTTYCGAYAGGICQHPFDTYERVKNISSVFLIPIIDESLTASDLFHSVCKISLRKMKYKKEKKNGESQVPVFVTNEYYYGIQTIR